MGYGLLAFDPAGIDAITGGEFLDWYDASLSNLAPCGRDGLSVALRDFYDALCADFPPAPDSQSRPELVETDGQTPHAVPLAEQSASGPAYIMGPHAIYLDCPFAMSDDIDRRVRALTRSLGLGYFDPEEGRLVFPESLARRLEGERIRAAALGRQAQARHKAEEAARAAELEAARAEYYSGITGFVRKALGREFPGARK